MKLNKKIKTLLALGVISVTTASSMIPVNALSKDTIKSNCEKKSIYVCINGVDFKLPLDVLCPIKANVPKFSFDLKNNSVTALNPDKNSEACKKPSTSNNNTNVDNKPSTPNNSTNVDNKPSTPNNNTNVDNKPSTPSNNTNVDNKPSTPDNSTAQSGNFSSYQREIVNIVNAERSKRGLAPLTLDSSLSNVATKKSQDMINRGYFDHNSPTYGSPFDMMKQFGISYKAAGENIAMGQKDPQDVMNSWMNSDGHRKNILSPNFTHIGVGIAKASNGQLYWTQMFIGK
ncbi:CAP domain-containing protein [Romboutsia sp. 1001216sp1]|uniref:CAP domain-containing protein n=1 Tax=Romboutsia sp. 1001216sp1 TaxID=2986997 RepID=UPI00232D386F|nr:CAP domain-containing protein [Romboutsia sp. 1001216sp1]MDB8805682.1 CAP domain-containing protein [Romboutsia sp. 1001216sp1]MDB8807534.1 CAP domain-containing protein [Romboutsia sp. 1001216sp1]MDB8811157.1 CAP domain-containing protein [Romboutsia sp. 1001216sp1]MDB8816877.1 CAP domain-containing protein [Romboutsia sp. 1001216sp1]MDB8819605.1 CAP domain-containing protein [Romboutsia sp. 1001216sp1]